MQVKLLINHDWGVNTMLPEVQYLSYFRKG